VILAHMGLDQKRDRCALRRQLAQRAGRTEDEIAHAADIDVLHLHDHPAALSLPELERWTETLQRLGVPLVLTLIVYITYHTVAIRRKHGVLPYFKSLVPPGLPGWLKPILFVLEFLTYFVIRPLTLALRLMGNMLAGHLMLLVFILGGEYLLLHGGNLFLKFSGVLSFGFSIGMTFFELLIEFLQAFIFTLLAALYIADAVSEHH